MTDATSMRAIRRIAVAAAASLAMLAAQTAPARTRPLAAPSLAGVTMPVAAVVPVATVLNEVKCDYLDFAFSDYARQRRLAVGKVHGVLQLTLLRRGEQAALGVPVAPAALRLDDAPSVTRSSGDRAGHTTGLSVPFAMDPALALDPGHAGLDCAPPRRLARTILDFTQLAAQFADARRLAPTLTVTSPLRYRGQFVLRQAPGGVDVVLVSLDPARVGADAAFVQAFDLWIETDVPSWFADVGAATAEPNPIEPIPARPGSAVVRPSGAVPTAAAPRIELRAIDPAPPAVRTRFRVPIAPRPIGTPPARRCINDAAGEPACY